MTKFTVYYTIGSRHGHQTVKANCKPCAVKAVKSSLDPHDRGKFKVRLVETVTQ